MVGLLVKRHPDKNVVSKIGTWGVLAIVILLSVFRFDVGFDYPYYFKSVEWPPNFSSLSRIEEGSRLFFDFTLWSRWPPLLFVLFGVPTYVLTFYTLERYTPDFKMAVLVYFAFFYSISLGPIRQGLALAIVLYGYKYLKDYCLWKYLIICAIAYIFHHSAVVAVLFPFIYRHFNIKLCLIAILGISIGFGAISYLSLETIGLGNYTHYLDSMDKYKGGGIIMYIYPAIILMMIFLYVRLKKTLPEKNLFYIVAIGSVMPFVLGSHLGLRVASYFNIYLLILIPAILNNYKTVYRLFTYNLLVLYFIFFMYIASNNPIKPIYTPYKTVFEINIEHPHFKK